MSVDAMIKWIVSGTPSPPPHVVKIETIRHYMQTYNARKVIETGTHVGTTAAFLGSAGIDITTIELSPEYHARAVEKFANRPNVTCVLGDSAVKLDELLSELNEPAVLWLDAHFSGGDTARSPDSDTPIVQELLAIHRHRRVPHVILIDDARCFGPAFPDYPALADIEALARVLFPKYKFSVFHDIMRIAPPL